LNRKTESSNDLSQGLAVDLEIVSRRLEAVLAANFLFYLCIGKKNSREEFPRKIQRCAAFCDDVRERNHAVQPAFRQQPQRAISVRIDVVIMNTSSSAYSVRFSVPA